MTILDLLAADAVIGPEIDRVVVVAPHPDDEVLACGLLLATAVDLGIDVRVVAVTDGEAAYPGHDPVELADLRRGEQLAALAELGIGADCVHRAGLPDGRVADHVPFLAEIIAARCSTGTLLVAPSVHDWHPDHEACGAAVRHLARTSYATSWSSLFWAHHHPERLVASGPRLLRLSGTERQCHARQRAIACHRSQFRRPAGRGAPILGPDRIAHLSLPFETYVELAS